MALRFDIKSEEMVIKICVHYYHRKIYFCGEGRGGYWKTL